MSEPDLDPEPTPYLLWCPVHRIHFRSIDPHPCDAAIVCGAPLQAHSHKEQP